MKRWGGGITAAAEGYKLKTSVGIYFYTRLFWVMVFFVSTDFTHEWEIL